MPYLKPNQKPPPNSCLTAALEYLARHWSAIPLFQTGVMGLGWHQPKLPGMGDVQWGPLFAALTDVGYRGPVCIEVEDRAYEGPLEERKRALRQSKRYLEQWVSE